MSSAKSVPSTPGGQSDAASTSSGMKASWPKTVSTRSSPKVKSVSGMPRSRLTWVTSNSCERPATTLAMAVHLRVTLVRVGVWVGVRVRVGVRARVRVRVRVRVRARVRVRVRVRARA